MGVVMLVINSRVRIPLTEFEFSFARSSGPGGQNVNKVNTKATLRWPVVASESLPDDVRQRFLTLYRSKLTTGGELILSSQRYRDQGRNVADCLEKLRAMLTAAATRPKPRRPTKPSRGSVQRRLEHKRQQGQKKQGRGWHDGSES
jgi:ribosome-associated protein